MKIFAHRGASGYAPENTLTAIKKAIEMKADGIEIFGAEDIMLDTVGRNKERIAQYIKNQIEEDKIMDQMTLKEYFDPFNVEKKAILIAEWGYTRKADQIVRL